jgi:DNA-binding PadR family transcriptional regulator
MPDPGKLLPLTHLSFQILLALADENRHGYGIIKEVTRRTEGAIRPATGTLYGALQRMLEDGLIQEVESRAVGPDDDERRRYYALTPFGRRVAVAEAARLARVLGVAQEKRLV